MTRKMTPIRAVLMVIVTVFAQTMASGSPGKIAADSRFRVQPNGFQFENWGDEYPNGNLTADDVRCLFGDQVCARFDGTTCVPTPAAKIWIDTMNEIMTSGHCEGMAALSTAFFTQQENSQHYGGSTAFALDPSNAALLRSISAYFTTQALEPVASVTAQTRTMSLNDIVKTLTEAMTSQKEFYTIGIYGPQGGHAITPYAVADLGKGIFRIHVYDNNYPGADKYIEVDVPADAWRYAAAAFNPSEDASPWEGKSGTMDLTPLSVRLQPLVCPFCENAQPVPRAKNCQQLLKPPPATSANTSEKSSASQAKPAAKQPESKTAAKQPQPKSLKKVQKGTIAVYSDASCKQLNAIDKRSGKRMAFGGRQPGDRIVGATMTPFKGSTGCYMQLPADAQYEISLSGESDSSDTPVEIAMFLPGYVYSVRDLTPDDETPDVLTLGDGVFEYVPGADSEPIMMIATDDLEGADVLYIIDGFSLGAGYGFIIATSETGGFVFDTDDPEIDGIDLEGILSDLDGDEDFILEDLEFSDESDLFFELDDEGELEIDLDRDGDGEYDETLWDSAEEDDDSGDIEDREGDDDSSDDSGDDDSSDDSSSDDSSDDDSSDDSGSDDSSDDSSSDDSGSDDSSSDDSGSDDSGSDDSSSYDSSSDDSGSDDSGSDGASE